MEKMLSDDDVVRLLGLDERGLHRPREALRWLRRTGKLRYVMVGRRAMYRREWLEEFIETNATQRRGPSS